MKKKPEFKIQNITHPSTPLADYNDPLLRELVAHPDFAREPADAQDRIRATMELMGKLGAWADEMLRLSPGTLDKVLSLGASVQRFVRGDAAAAPAEARKPGEDDHLQGGLPMI